MMYVVICRVDTDVDGNKGEYVIATRRLFTEADAYAYAKTVAQSREPLVVTPEYYLQLCSGFRLHSVN